MTHRLITASLITTLALLAGCQSVNPPIEGRSDPFVPPQVTFATRDLRNRTAIGPINVERDDAGNHLHVTVPIRSAMTRTLYIDYRVTFVDSHGAVLEQTGWTPKTLEANTPESISVSSSSDRAADFTIALRQAR